MRSWVRIPVPHTLWIIYSHLFVVTAVLMFEKAENKLIKDWGWFIKI